jgi:hypothetical protein
MLIKLGNDRNLINLDNVAHMFMANDSLIVTVPSATNDTGYDNIQIIADNYGQCQYYLKCICALYREYVVLDSGYMFIPPKVFEIPENMSNVIYPNQVSVRPIWESARITFDNKAAMGFVLSTPYKTLVENVDYTVTFPFFRGQAEQHRFVFYLLSSHTYFSFGITYTNGWKTFTEDIELNPEINVNT